ncbi:hypothetical protein LCGC14_2188810 [marine sediment metagenome]|uniref:Uncharacterized protein n=1 Tax=marine sediment metagenome TaxID=412755 RepID=A0A0F9DK35_9ZZZZ
MKTKIDNIKEAFKSILCHCAETTEFLNKSQILELIAKEASRGWNECNELEETRKEVDGLISELERREEEN